jgi:ATP-binding cassette subfamily B protein
LAATTLRTSYLELLPYIRTQWWLLTRAIVCTTIYIGGMPLLAMIFGRVSEAVGEGSIVKITEVSGYTLLLFTIQGLCQYGQDTMMARVALQITQQLRINTFAHLQSLDLSYFAESRAGDLSYRLTEDIDRIGEVIGKFFYQFVPSVLQLILILGYMLYLNWILTMTVLIVAPLLAVIVAWFGDKMLSLARRSQDQVSNLSAFLAEIFSGIRLVRAFGAEDFEIDRFTKEAEMHRQSKYAAERIRSMQYPIVSLLQAVGIIILIWIAVWQIAQGKLEVKEFVSFCAAVALLIDPIRNVTNNFNELRQTQASTDRIFELFTLKPAITEKKNAKDLGKIKGKIEFQNVYFRYNQTDWVLQNINTVIFPGEIVALVGASGAGKSTLMNLLLRFYDPTMGKVLIDDRDIQEVTLKSLRRHIAIVPQETILFSGTIATNIAFGKTGVDREELERAAKIANAHNFIMELPQQYDTWVGENGVNLSGGQRQRISIARAVLHDPAILLLDEATSALDSESEALVQEALQRLMVNRTVLIIAHRLATVRNCDRIFVLEKGQIIESGNHGELLALNGRYSQLHARQFSHP